MRKAVNLPGWENYPARAEIERRLGARVVLENDARVAALGEQWLGAARGVPNMAMLTLGTGIGGGIVLGGKIWHGMNGMAGEFGHVTVEPEGYPCACGNRGCSERYASASALLRMAREAVASGQAPSLAEAASSDAEFGAKSIYNLAIQGDEPARRIFRNFGRYLGILLADLVNVLNLEMYVIGGGVSSAWDAFAPTMFEELRQRSIVYAATAPTDPLRDSSGKEEGASAQAGSRSGQETIITRAVLGSDAGLVRSGADFHAGRLVSARRPLTPVVVGAALREPIRRAACKKTWFCSGVPIVTRMQFGAPQCPSGRTATPSSCKRLATGAASSPRSQNRKFAAVGTTR